MKRSFRTWFLGVTTVFAILALAAATYAWFTANRAVQTNTATARTGDETLELQISTQGGNAFRDEGTVSIQQVNRTDSGTLLPVSTTDLVNFVSTSTTTSGVASHFQLIKDEANYYHGRIYLKAVGEGWSAGSRMNLYLDESDGILGQSSDGYLLNASRLGLMFNGDSSSKVIVRLSESENPNNAQVYNTEVDGKILGKNQVLGYNNGNVYPAADPSVPVKDYTIGFSGNQMQLPDKYLLSMEFGKVYAVDIYFYLEGCDPDCSDSIQLDESRIHLAFYGVLDQKGGR